MRKYLVCTRFNTYVSTSRNAIKHARDFGQSVKVYTLDNCLVSWAIIGEDGRPHRAFIG